MSLEQCSNARLERHEMQQTVAGKCRIEIRNALKFFAFDIFFLYHSESDISAAIDSLRISNPSLLFLRQQRPYCISDR